MAEDRERFDELLAKLGIPRPVGALVTSDEEAQEAAKNLKISIDCSSFLCIGRSCYGNRI